MKKRKRLLSVISFILSLIILLSVINFPTIKVSAAGTVGDFVVRCYQVVMGRDPADFEKQYWVDRLTKEDAQDGRATGGFVAYSFLISPEYLNKQCSEQQFVESLYVLFMDRNADASEVDYWCQKAESGELNRLGIIAGFINSSEFHDICFNCGITAGSFPVTNNPTQEEIAQLNQINLFVDRMYDKCMGRRAEYGGQYYWLQKLLSKEITGADCAHSFYVSDEFINKNLSDDEYVETLYLTFMGRSPEPGGKEYWIDKMNSGMTRDEVFQGFAMAPEFESICSSYGINRGTYTATIRSSQEDNQEEKQFRKTKIKYSCGDYAIATYEDPHSVNYMIVKRYDQNGTFKSYEDYSDHNADFTETKSGYTQFDEDGNAQYKYYSKQVDSADRTKSFIYSYSDEWTTLDGYWENENEKYFVEENGEKIECTHTIKSSFYESNGVMNAYTLYTYDEKGRMLEQNSYYSDGRPLSKKIVEYLYKYDYEDFDKKSEIEIYYNWDGTEDRREVSEYNDNGLLVKKSYYNQGELNNYTIKEYDERENVIKESNYTSDNKLNYWWVYEYDSSGRWIGEVDYVANGAVSRRFERKYDSAGNIIGNINYNPDNQIIDSEIFEYNSQNFITKITMWDQSTNKTTVCESTYDQYNNCIKDTKTVDGQLVSWVEMEYEEY